MFNPITEVCCSDDVVSTKQRPDDDACCGGRYLTYDSTKCKYAATAHFIFACCGSARL